MYIPPHFAEHDRTRILRLMHEHPFATIISAGSAPVISQAPTLATEAADGVAIEFHLAVHNPQCERLHDGSECLVLYTGPDSYVSPSWYEQHPSVPTWNYASVVAAGSVALLSDDELAAQVAELSRIHEERVGGTWRFDDLPARFRQQLLARIRGFRVRVSELNAKFKLSQNRTPADRRRVADRLANSTDPLDQRVGRLMMEECDPARTPAAPG